eukprot:scaffold18333_cov152-Isochrysis_galbana.AAC.1
MGHIGDATHQDTMAIARRLHGVCNRLIHIRGCRHWCQLSPSTLQEFRGHIPIRQSAIQISRSIFLTKELERVCDEMHSDWQWIPEQQQQQIKNALIGRASECWG